MALPLVVPIVADDQAEANETFSLSLINPGDGARIGTPSSIAITIEDDDGLVRTLNIRDAVDPNGPDSWTATDDAAWLTLSQESGTGPATITATASLQGLAPGTYGGTIVVSTPSEWNSPQVVQVTLKVLP